MPDLEQSNAVRRRTIVKGAAWSIPVIVASSALPGTSASATQPQFTYTLEAIASGCSFSWSDQNSTGATGMVMLTSTNGGRCTLEITDEATGQTITNLATNSGSVTTPIVQNGQFGYHVVDAATGAEAIGTVAFTA